jgi:glycosyltransferase involved in cell wall biosynthesis
MLGLVSVETTLMGSAATSLAGIRDRTIHPVLRRLLGWSDAFVVTSRRIRDQLLTARLSRTCTVPYPPFSLEKYEAAHRLPAMTVPAGANPVIAHVGRLSEEKGFHFLLGALPDLAAKFPRIHLLVAGTGDEEKRLRNLARERGVNSRVTFLRFQPNPFFVLKAADLLVIPSRKDGCPIAAVEAMSAGLPVIASDVGGILELVSQETEVLVLPVDFRALSAAIARILDDKGLNVRMSTAAKERAFSVYHPRNFMSQMEDIYTSRLSRRHSA